MKSIPSIKSYEQELIILNVCPTSVDGSGLSPEYSFNGRWVPPSDGPSGHPGYYRACGVTDRAAELCANYLFHTTVEDRRYWFDLLCIAPQTQFKTQAKLIACYRKLVKTKSREHKLLLEMGGVIVMDATGRMH